MSLAPRSDEERNTPPLDSIAPQYVSSDPEPTPGNLIPPEVLLCIFIHG